MDSLFSKKTRQQTTVITIVWYYGGRISAFHFLPSSTLTHRIPSNFKPPNNFRIMQRNWEHPICLTVGILWLEPYRQWVFNQVVHDNLKQLYMLTRSWCSYQNEGAFCSHRRYHFLGSTCVLCPVFFSVPRASWAGKDEFINHWWPQRE